jgi:hypothetical protein
MRTQLLLASFFLVVFALASSANPKHSWKQHNESEQQRLAFLKQRHHKVGNDSVPCFVSSALLFSVSPCDILIEYADISPGCVHTEMIAAEYCSYTVFPEYGELFLQGAWNTSTQFAGLECATSSPSSSSSSRVESSRLGNPGTCCEYSDADCSNIKAENVICASSVCPKTYRGLDLCEQYLTADCTTC